MAEALLTRAGKREVVVFEGVLNFRRAAEVRTALIKALIDANRIEIDLGNVIRVDLSFLQLLCSANRSAAKLKKILTIAGIMPVLLRNAATGAGYSRTQGCALDCKGTCLWVEPGPVQS